ncbi:TetR/AcrR family transcriptional regulator [Haladaptatus sp. R4]|uniref:TetR/AcrR family transcriptional regulator n=1 Tax=Haladaptatus sp. R4 TaxID=1679489 RepID=UPI00082507FD|nr:TetR/AcrR family transcriptional regulator [Haladaptatus sp. R4]
MRETDSLSENGSGDRKEEIMRATYRVFRTEGYAGLSISKIADEVGVSKSALYNHYSGKDELLVAFLEYVMDKYSDEIQHSDTENPIVYLKLFKKTLLSEESIENNGNSDVPIDLFETIMQLKVQAVHNEVFREHFTRDDQFEHERLADRVRSGIEEGYFQDVDPDATAEFVQTVVEGAILRQTTTDSTSLQNIRRELDEYLRCRLIADPEKFNLRD